MHTAGGRRGLRRVQCPVDHQPETRQNGGDGQERGGLLDKSVSADPCHETEKHRKECDKAQGKRCGKSHSDSHHSPFFHCFRVR
ncbi:hypothetical protein GCM10007079_48430 [Nocardiopsis terrae]|nr:hypothetical protein GCM10007079_48430 [Nocardiopsis terrae]